MFLPLKSELQALDHGVVVHDGALQTDVVVVSPVLLLKCDNPRAAELLGHMGANANKFCRVCMVCELHGLHFIVYFTENLRIFVFFFLLQTDRRASPHLIGDRRTKQETLEQIATMSSLNAKGSSDMSKSVGIRSVKSPLLDLSFDPFRFVVFQ